jgi:hypothetical protein
MCEFEREAHLVEAFTRHIQCSPNPFHSSGTSLEFDYRSGKADIILKTPDDLLFAFEAKLSNWRVALHQAYRNSHFAHFCYVVLPRGSAARALEHCREFNKRGVGLCIVDEKGVRVAIAASQNQPLLPWLTREALMAISVQIA